MSTNNNNDKQILESIFNPFLTTSFNDNNNEQNENFGENLSPDEESAKILELEAINQCNSSNIEKALQLLNQAINIAPNRSSMAQVLRIMGNNNDALLDLDKAIDLSSGKGFIACQAYCQRGLIYLVENKEKKGFEDLKISADLGNDFAKTVIARTNPYAALCNKMLKQMIENVNKEEEN